jgi:mannose-1-phosphate guanylyltransferase
VEHQIAAAVKAGVKHVILAVGWKADDMQEALAEFRTTYGIEITCSVEDSPLGTAGPIRLAEKIIRESGDDNEPFFVFNSDVICEFPLAEMLTYHKAHGKEGTICVTRVDDPSKFGVVVSDHMGRIERFVEKPKEYISDRINAGLYILNKPVIDRIDPGVFRMIETDVFPKMANEGQLYSFNLNGYWADIGQPRDFLRGMKLHLASLGMNNKTDELTPRSRLYVKDTDNGFDVCGSTVLIDASAKIEEGSVIGPNVTIGRHVHIGRGCRISNSSIFEGTKIGNFSHINESIIGWRNRVGKWVKMDNNSVTGENVTISDELFINGAIVLPHKSIKDKILQEGTILM